MAASLMSGLRLAEKPIAISFLDQSPVDISPLDNEDAPANSYGRTGKVSAGCVFWMKASNGAFSTIAQDHANCSVGSYTHGLLPMEAAAQKDDIAAILESGWVCEEDFEKIPRVTEKVNFIVYGPLEDAKTIPDVVLIRPNAFGLMVLKDAFPSMSMEGKPQCHIIALAKSHNQIAASVGCALSRVRTGMKQEEGTCALPGNLLPEVLNKVQETIRVDQVVAKYAAVDAKRFDRQPTQQKPTEREQ
jgi:uncharacterized protein (DUF169 family)